MAKKKRKKSHFSQISKEDLREVSAKGGLKTRSRYGRAHFAKLAKMREVFGGGRPRKKPAPKKGDKA